MFNGVRHLPRSHNFSDWLLARLLQTGPQVRCFGVLVGKLSKVVLHSGAEGFIANVPMKHTDNGGTLKID